TLIRYLLYSFSSFFLSLIPPPPRSTLFPYTTLFRSTTRSEAGPLALIRISSWPERRAPSDVFGNSIMALFTIWILPAPAFTPSRSEEHTSELQSLAYLVCRLLLEKKKKK